MTKSSNSLPEKCCARCGFLYGLAGGAATSADAVFDPDLIRLPSYPPRRGQKTGYDPTVIASRPYTCQREHLENPRGTMEGQESRYAVKHYVATHVWSNTTALCCYLNKMDPLSSIGPVSEPGDSPLWHWIADDIRSDRESCDGFFEYHPGYTPAQHIELRIEEQRVQRTEAHEEILVEWSAKHAKQLAQWTQDYDDRWRKIEYWLMVFLGLLTILFIILGWIVSSLIK